MAKNVPATTFSADLAVLEAELGEEAGGFNPLPVIVKISHGDEVFNIPGLPPEKRLVGVILASRMVRVFFPRMGQEADTKALLAFTGNRPFCSSQNHVEGRIVDALWDSKDVPEAATIIKQKLSEGALECAKCPFNEWESVSYLGRSGRGKACASLRRLLYWRPGIEIPVILSVPTSSIREWDTYCSSLAVGRLKHHQVITEVALEHRAAPGMEWSVLKFSMEKPLDEEAASGLLKPVYFGGVEQSLARALVALFKGKELSVEDYPENGSSETVQAEEDF